MFLFVLYLYNVKKHKKMVNYYFKMLFYYDPFSGEGYGFFRDIKKFKEAEVVNNLYTLEGKEVYSRGEYSLKEAIFNFCGLIGIECKLNRLCRRKYTSNDKSYYYNCYELWSEDIEKIKKYSQDEFNKTLGKVRKILKEGIKTPSDLIYLSYSAFPRVTEYFCVLDNKDSLKIKNLDYPFIFYTPIELKEALEGVNKIEIIGGGWFK